MNTAAASVISASASAPPMWNSRRKTSDVLRKLSLNAAKNWVQNRGAKRRVISRDEDMAFPLVPTGATRARPSHPITSWQTPLCPLPASGARARAAPTGADGLRNNNLGKTTIARRGRAKRRHWREANADRAQNKGGRPGAARRSGPARFDFATNDAGAAARRAPSEWLRRLTKRRHQMRA